VGLRTRLALLFAATVAVLVTAGGALLTEQLSTGVDSALDSSLRVRADALAQHVGPDGLVADFQDGGGDSGPLLSVNETLAQVIAATGVWWSPPMVVVVGGSRRVATEAVNGVQTALWLGGPAAVIVGGIGAWLVAGAVLRPVERMRATAAEISAADSDARLVVPAGRDEIARLGEAMNALLERLQQALSHQRAFVADARHELRTPLTMLRTELELAGRPGRDKDSLIAAVQAAAMDTDRLIRLAEDLLTLARADSAQVILEREPLELAALVVDSVTAVTALARSKSVDLELALSPVTVMGDRGRLRQVVDNLLDNALRHAPPGSTLTVTLACTPTGRPSPSAHAAPTGAVLRVMDEGPGFPTEFLPHAFDRFARADPARTDGPGTGLGLAIVASLVGGARRLRGRRQPACRWRMRPGRAPADRVRPPDQGARLPHVSRHIGGTSRFQLPGRSIER
jgi:two-component system OmpR family sensor kinase